MTTAAEELRAAAASIRNRAEKATPGPYASDVMAGQDHENGEWWAEYWVRAAEHPSGVLVQVGSDEQAEADAEHIATWSPGPALAVAAWLEQTADRHQPHQLPTAPDGYSICWTCDKGPDNHVPAPCPYLAAALAVARAVPGGAP